MGCKVRFHFVASDKIPEVSRPPPVIEHGEEWRSAGRRKLLKPHIRYYVNTRENPPRSSWTHPAAVSSPPPGPPPYGAPPGGAPAGNYGGPGGYDSNRQSPYPGGCNSGPPSGYGSPPPQQGYGGYGPPQGYGGYGSPPPQGYGAGGYNPSYGPPSEDRGFFGHHSHHQEYQQPPPPQVVYAQEAPKKKSGLGGGMGTALLAGTHLYYYPIGN